jgi:hypothetical protein
MHFQCMPLLAGISTTTGSSPHETFNFHKGVGKCGSRVVFVPKQPNELKQQQRGVAISQI